MKKICISMLAVFLAFLTAFLTPMRIFAETGKYISEIRIAYGDDGIEKLEDAGYEVMDTNVNQGGNGESVWIGYKTTSDPDEAITDISLMNMEGKYSFEEYQNELNEISNNVTVMLNNFKASIEEFRTNYNNGSEYAKRAYTLLQKIKDDDTGKTLGSLFLNKRTTDDVYHTIFMQGNSDILTVIYNALALGCTDYEGDTFLDRIEKSTYKSEYDTSHNKAHTQVNIAVADFKTQLLTAETVYEEANAAESVDAYFESVDETDLAGKQYYYNLYTAATNTKYGNTGLSLFEAMMLPTEYVDDDTQYLDEAMIDILSTALTDGQVGVVGTVGLGTLVGNALSSAEAASATKFQYVDSALAELEDQDALSVYFGVDRTLFTDTDDIALTAATLADKAKTNSEDFGKSSDWRTNADLRVALAVLTGVSFATSIGCGAVAIAMSKTAVTTYTCQWYVMGLHSQIDGILYASKEELISAIKDGFFVRTNDWQILRDQTVNGTTCCFGTYSAMAVKVFSVVAAVALVVSLVLLFLTLSSYLYHPDTENIEYTQIPRVLVDMRVSDSGSKEYYAYYAAKLVDADEDETESTKLYGDLNGLNGTEEWYVLYYSKDSRLGAPLTTASITRTAEEGKTISTRVKSGYVPVHDFQSDAPANFNQYSRKSGALTINIYFKQDTSASTNTASLFNTGNVALVIGAFAGGALLSFAITFIAMKKGKKKSAAAAE